MLSMNRSAMKHFSIKQVAVKCLCTLMVTATITTGFVLAPTAVPFSTMVTVHAATSPSVKAGVESIFPLATLNVTWDGKSTGNPTFFDLTGRVKFRDLIGTYKSDLADLANQAFPDVSPDSWYAHLVTLAAYIDWIAGYPEGTFKGNQAVTKGEYAQMFASNLFSTRDIANRNKTVKNDALLARKLGGSPWWAGAYHMVSRYMPHVGGVAHADNYGTTNMNRGAVVTPLRILLWFFPHCEDS